MRLFVRSLVPSTLFFFILSSFLILPISVIADEGFSLRGSDSVSSCDTQKKFKKKLKKLKKKSKRSSNPKKIRKKMKRIRKKARVAKRLCFVEKIDVNGNGCVDQRDEYIVNHLALNPEARGSVYDPAADLDADGEITQKDVNLVKEHLADPNSPDLCEPWVFYDTNDTFCINDSDAQLVIDALSSSPTEQVGFDMDGNGIITPLDALIVVNFLNSSSSPKEVFCDSLGAGPTKYDLDGNGCVGLGDIHSAFFLLEHNLTESPYYPSADLNSDGSVTPEDLIKFNNYYNSPDSENLCAEYLLYDANRDGCLNHDDAETVINAIDTPSILDDVLLDINNDQVITPVDANMILTYVNGSEISPEEKCEADTTGEPGGDGIQVISDNSIGSPDINRNANHSKIAMYGGKTIVAYFETKDNSDSTTDKVMVTSLQSGSWKQPIRIDVPLSNVELSSHFVRELQIAIDPKTSLATAIWLQTSDKQCAHYQCKDLFMSREKNDGSWSSPSKLTSINSGVITQPRIAFTDDAQGVVQGVITYTQINASVSGIPGLPYDGTTNQYSIELRNGIWNGPNNLGYVNNLSIIRELKPFKSGYLIAIHEQEGRLLSPGGGVTGDVQMVFMRHLNGSGNWGSKQLVKASNTSVTQEPNDYFRLQLEVSGGYAAFTWLFLQEFGNSAGGTQTRYQAVASIYNSNNGDIVYTGTIEDSLSDHVYPQQVRISPSSNGEVLIIYNQRCIDDLSENCVYYSELEGASWSERTALERSSISNDTANIEFRELALASNNKRVLLLRHRGGGKNQSYVRKLSPNGSLSEAYYPADNGPEGSGYFGLSSQEEVALDPTTGDIISSWTQTYSKQPGEHGSVIRAASMGHSG